MDDDPTIAAWRAGILAGYDPDDNQVIDVHVERAAIQGEPATSAPKNGDGNGAHKGREWRRQFDAECAILEQKKQANEAPPGYFVGVRDLSARLLDSIDRRKTGKEAPIQTPFPQFTKALEGGFWPGLHTITGGTGSFKTELATTITSYYVVLFDARCPSRLRLFGAGSRTSPMSYCSLSTEYSMVTHLAWTFQ